MRKRYIVFPWVDIFYKFEWRYLIDVIKSRWPGPWVCNASQSFCIVTANSIQFERIYSVNVLKLPIWSFPGQTSQMWAFQTLFGLKILVSTFRRRASIWDYCRTLRLRVMQSDHCPKTVISSYHKSARLYCLAWTLFSPWRRALSHAPCSYRPRLTRLD